MAMKLTRRDFVRTSLSSALAAGAASAVPWHAAAFSGRTAPWPGIARAGSAASKVAVVSTSDRKQGVTALLRLLDVPTPKGQRVVIKPNFNSADIAPGSTHNDTLAQIMTELWDRDARAITIGERSGPPVTKKVMEDKGIFDLARDLRASVVNFEELADSDWVPANPPGSHWSNGYHIPRLVAEAPYLVSTCCLKTHGFGGVFTMSLKLAVGMTPKNLMREMHGSKEHMRRMIAEINAAYKPTFIVLDGVDAFVDGGPSQGRKVAANLMVAGTDRIAVDAVGLAILKELGSNAAIMDRKIFEQEQIQRAVELGLGITGPEQIEILSGDGDAKPWADRIRTRLAVG